MNSFLKVNKNLLIYSSLILLVIPIFGINFLMSLLSNILLLFFLIPFLILLLILISFNSYKSKINICNNCGSISFGLVETCINCGADLNHNNKNNQLANKPGESTIEIKAEEIK